MSDTSAIDAATRRLTLALDALEAAGERCRIADFAREELATQVHALDEDRSKLASDLDAAVAHSRSLEIANREIARRIDAAMDNIRSVLGTNDR